MKIKYLKFVNGIRIYREKEIEHLPPFGEYSELLNNKEVKK